MITDSVTMQNIFNYYGFTPNSRGFIRCPFHSEKTPSLGIYQNGRKWKCFGCGEGGSVIDFVMKYSGIGFKQAIAKINYDFNLRLPLSGHISIKKRREIEQREKALALRRQEDARIKKEQREEYESLLDQWAEYDKIITERRRKHPESKYLIDICEEGDAKIIAKMRFVEYLLDGMEVK